MLSFVLKRLLQAVPVGLGVTLITFLLIYVIPGDPVEAMLGQRADETVKARLRTELGLDAPLYWQYAAFLGRLAQGDLGRSYISQRPVRESLMTYLPYTAQLAVGAMLIMLVFGLSTGVISAQFYGQWPDQLGRLAALLCVSMPVFWFGLALILVFSIELHWLPASGVGQGFGGTVAALILPSVALGTRAAALIARVTRASLLEALTMQYIVTARAKGLPEWRVVYKHGLRNALIPVITIATLDFASFLNGAVLTEAIFGRPGIGSFLMDAISRRDFPVIQGVVLFGAMVFVGMNLLADVLYGWANPRLRDETSLAALENS